MTKAAQEPLNVSSPSRHNPVRVPTVADEVARGITAMIMSAQFRPGERLVEERLAEIFEVSRPPIREALRVLQRDGIVTNTPRKGFIVIPITADDVREIYEFRWILERSALQIAVPVDSHERLIPLQRAIDRMAQESTQADPEEMLSANSEFHHALVALAGNSRLTTAYTTISAQLRLCMAMNLRFRREHYGDPAEAVRRHQLLLDLIAAGDLPPLLAELQDHGDRSFMGNLDELIGTDQ